jgi:hypothetical protein
VIDVPISRIAVLIAVATTLGAASSHASDVRLRLEVTPRVSLAPAAVRVRVFVEPRAENRALHIVADSGEYYRSSVLPLDGANAAHITETTLKNLPSGESEISVVLVSSSGEQTIARRDVMVTSTRGEP